MPSEASLHKRIESVQDVAGWKSIIFLPFHLIWQFVIMFSILYVFGMTTNMVTYHLDHNELIYIGYFCDCLYLTDVFCSILHHALKSTRKLKNYRTRPWVLILVDCVSLIPFELIYTSVYFPEEQHSKTSRNYMFLNRNLRIHRFFFYFSQTNSQIQSLKHAFTISFFELLIYGFCMTHTASCIFQSLKSEDEMKACPEGRFDCMILNEMNVFFLMAGRFIGDEKTYDTREKRLACNIILTISYFYMYAIMAPLFIFSCKKRLRMFFEFWNRFKRLRIFVSNMIEDEGLKRKTLEEFRTVWTYGKGDIEPELLKTFPVNLRKNAYSDVYWDALRHSELFQNISYSCKRSLSLKIIGDFYMPDTFFWDIGENKNSMLYLASGILQIMSEENSKSPIMSFSGGTILGESSIFFPVRSKAILRVATYSEIHVLQAKDFFRVIADYPKDREIVKKNLQLRLRIAKMTRIRKTEISKIIFNRNMGEVGDFVVDEDDSIKWIKTQFRHIAIMQEMYSKNLKEEVEPKDINSAAKQLHELKTGIDHTSIYLPLLNLGEEIEVLTDLTCLKTSLPWVIDPNSHFMRLWRRMILLLVFFCSVVYPVFIAWWKVLPNWLINISQFITTINIVDIFMQLSTAIKTKDLVIVQSGAIFRYRLKRVSFYADFISALPLQMIFKHFWIQGMTEEPYLRLCIALSLLKVYNISKFLNEWCETIKGRFSLRVMIKYLFLYSLVVYWSAALLNLIDVECMLQSCKDGGWYKREFEELYPQYRELGAAFFAVNYLMDIPSVITYTHYFPSVAIIWFTVLIMVFTLSGWFGDFNAAYMLEMTQEVKFRSLLQSVINFMNDRNIVGRIKKRVLDTMYFQWYYDCGDYITQQRAMLEDAPAKLKREVNKATIFKVMKTCEIFRSENEALIWYLCRKCSRLALPANSIVLTFGIQTMDLYIVYKGYLQLNSFLPKDVLDGIATPVLYGPGKILPLIIALNQMPSGVTARTITDCELIVISLEDFLTGLILNNCFKDYIETIKKVDLEPFRNAKLTISKITNVFGAVPESHKAPFAKYKCCGWILRMFLMKKSINSESTPFIRWELFRLFCLIFAAASWPIVFGTENEDRIMVIYFLLALDSFGWFDFYIKLHIAFYNKKGVFITHTLSTSWHYITTSFIIDFITFLPYLHSIYIIATDPHFEVDDYVVFFHSFIRLLSLSRVFLFVTNYEEIGNFVFYIKFFGYLLLILILLNCFIFLKMRSEITTTNDPDRPYEITPDGWISVVDVPSADNPAKMYLIMLYCVIMLISRCYPFFKDFTGEILAYEIVFAMVGIFFVFLGHAFFITRETGAKMNFTIYQYHMKSFTHFLKEEKAEDSISREAINHFEHEWERKRGEDLQDVFSRFPNILEEDLMHPIYRKTMRGVPCFSNANEGFFRTLSRLFVEVHFKKGSTIMFAKGVHKDIYFIHNGECYVREGDVILRRGSMLGDIKGRGIMTNNISARTHTILLMIKSPQFFVILNNFYDTEVAFYEAIEKVEDFIESRYLFTVPKQEQFPRDVTVRKESEKEKAECSFELADDTSVLNVTPAKKAKGKVKMLFKIHPHSLTTKILRVIFVVDAILTSFVIPLIIGLRLAIISALAVMYILDAIWVIKIVTTLRTSFIATDTGNLVTNGKEIFRNYVKQSDGFVVDALSVFPFEYLHDLIKYYYDDWNSHLRKYCYTLRLLRLLGLWIRVEKEKRKISLRDRTRWFIIIMKQTIAYNFLLVINLLIATDDQMVIQDNQTEYTEELKDALLWGYLSMFNVYSGVGFFIFPPKNLTQISFYICLAMYSMIERSLLTSEVLSIINVSMYVKSEKLFKLQLMERYLSVSKLISFIQVRDVSPALKKKLMSYACDLFEHFKAEVEPWFLKTAPYYIRVQIMEDLYMQYFIKCYAFRGLSPDFLKQLAARLERHIYFPGDVIAEKGDIDYSMYFVHKGEVASVEKDPVYQGLDFETDFYEVGDYFGLEQGVDRSVPHTTTFRAITKVDLLSLNFFHWEDLRLAFPEAIENIRKKMQNSETKEQMGSKFKDNAPQ